MKNEAFIIEKNENIVYAGFFLRVVATFIDVFVLYIPLIMIEIAFGTQSIITIALNIVLWGAYTSLFIASNWKGTIGKKLLGLEVLNESLEQLTLIEAVKRYLLSLISFLLILPLFMIFFTQRRQTFHDYLVKSIVIDRYKTSSMEISAKIVQARKIFLGLAILLVIVLIVPLLPYVYYFIGYAKSLNEQRENVYRVIHELPNQSDNILNVYNKKLVDINKEFLAEKNEYSFFKLKIEEELLMSCVGKRYKVLENETYLRDARYFVENVRNIQIQNNEKLINAVKKYKKIYLDRYIGHELNLINGSIEQVQVNTKNYMCDINTSIDEIYDSFLIIYLTRQHMSKEQIESDPWLKQIIKYEPKFWKVYLNNEKVKSY